MLARDHSGRSPPAAAARHRRRNQAQRGARLLTGRPAGARCVCKGKGVWALGGELVRGSAAARRRANDVRFARHRAQQHRCVRVRVPGRLHGSCPVARHTIDLSARTARPTTINQQRQPTKLSSAPPRRTAASPRSARVGTAAPACASRCPRARPTGSSMPERRPPPRQTASSSWAAAWSPDWAPPAAACRRASVCCAPASCRRTRREASSMGRLRCTCKEREARCASGALAMRLVAHNSLVARLVARSGSMRVLEATGVDEQHGTERAQGDCELGAVRVPTGSMRTDQRVQPDRSVGRPI